MRSAAHLLLLLALLLLPILPVAPAWASDWVEGDGYRFRLPPEFVPMEDVDLEGMEDADQVLEMANSMFSSSGIDVDAQVFLRQRGIQPDAFLYVMAMHLEGELKEAMQGQLNLAQLERQMHQLQAEADRQGLPVEVSRVRRILVSAGRDALEVELEVDDPKVGDLNEARMLFVIEEGTICMLGYQGTRENATEDGMLWRAIVTSFRLEERGSILNLLMRYGPFILGGLVLLIALLFLRKSSAPKLVEPVGPTAGATDSSGSGFSRALDGLPVYGHASGGMRELDGDPLGEPEPLTAVPVGPTPSGPRKVPTIPRAAPGAEEAAAAGGGLRRPDQAAPAAPPPPLEPTPALASAGHDEAPPPSGGPSGLPRKLPDTLPAPPPPPPPPPPAPVAAPPLEIPASYAQPPVPPPMARPTPTPSPAVADRIEMPPVDDRAGSDQPTNVALRDATPSVPQADSSDEVLSRLMGLDEPAAGEPAQPLRKIARADADPKDADDVKIKRNSDFYE